MTIKYSVVIPLKNEERNIRALVEELEPIMASLQQPWELICVDDGSTDKTRAILRTLAQEKPYLKTLAFDKNYGQSSAFDAGFREAQGQFLITLDGDRQNDPADIPKMVALMQDQGYDLVCGIRKERRDTWLKRLLSLVANQVRSRICADGIEDTGCSLKVYRKSCLDRIKMYQGMHRFLPSLFKIEGFRIAQIPVNHRERTEGVSNYTLVNRSFNTIWDMLAVLWMRKRTLQYQIEQKF
jgi:dolichol-phosphate mannosyltransferase